MMTASEIARLREIHAGLDACDYVEGGQARDFLIEALPAALDEIERLRLREPTQAEGDANDGNAPLHTTGECFVDGWTGRRCVDCKQWTWGGPTRCVRCAERGDAKRLRKMVADLGLDPDAGVSK